MAKILIIEKGKGKPLNEVEFTEEANLQDFLEENPSLIPIEDIAENATPLLCIGREVGVPSGSIDLLFIGKDGILTVVETKLAKNPEARRTVVGQIIEYASYIYQWTADDVYEIANDYLKKDLDEIIEKLDDEDFRDKVEQNLRGGKIRLLIAVDKLVEPLKMTVTFLNDNSKFDILLLQIKNYEENELRKVLIPTLFGYKKVKEPRTETRRQWTEKDFLNDIVEKQCDKETTNGIRKLLEFAKANGKVKWGTGTVTGSFTFNERKLGLSIYSVYSNGNMSLNPGWMLAWNKVKQKEKVLDSFREELNQIPGIITLPKGAFYLMGVDKLPPQNVQALTKGNSLEQFEEAILSLCNRIEVED